MHLVTEKGRNAVGVGLNGEKSGKEIKIKECVFAGLTVGSSKKDRDPFLRRCRMPGEWNVVLRVVRVVVACGRGVDDETM